MMTSVTTSHISLDDRGVAWIEGTNTKVKEVVIEKLAFGWSPEEIHRQHPHLPLAKIYAALSHYFEHQAEIDADMERDHLEIEELRRSAGELPFVQRLRLRGTSAHLIGALRGKIRVTGDIMSTGQKPTDATGKNARGKPRR